MLNEVPKLNSLTASPTRASHQCSTSQAPRASCSLAICASALLTLLSMAGLNGTKADSVTPGAISFLFLRCMSKSVTKNTLGCAVASLVKKESFLYSPRPDL